ncbi:MAG: hypothetical protein U9R19_17240 [Bacteroidota bacterium]|nr:hypothetical protein [Bacteroidota bacterium]
MKKVYKNILIVVIVSLLSFSAWEAMAFDPPPPPGGHGETGDQPAGGGAPLSGGIGFLIALAAAYGTYRFRKSTSEEKESVG